MPEHRIGTREEWQVARGELAKLEARGPNATRVVLESRQQPADPDKEQAMRGNSEYLGKMLEASLERLEQLVTRGSES